MSTKTVLFLTFWYPNKNNPSFGIFVKRHAHAINSVRKIVVLSLRIEKSNSLFRKKHEVFYDEANVETHAILVSTWFYALAYTFLPLHYSILKRYIDQHLRSKYDLDVVHSNVLFPCAMAGHRLAKYLGCKHIITEHWTKVDKFFRVSLYKGFGKKVYDSADAITSVSGQLVNTLKKYTGNTNIKIIPNVIDSKEFYYDANVVKNAQLTFIAVSNWSNFKNPFYFLDALNELVKEGSLKNFKLVMIGEGQQLERVKTNNYDFEIDYKGAMNAREINAEMNKSHIFLHGSDFETFSVIIAEALMCGLPCVLSPVGIANEVINETNGFVTDNTVADWKNKILTCTRSAYNYAQIASQLQNKYDQRTVGVLFDDLYRDV